MHVVGVISDTHGDLPEAALAVLRGEYTEEQVVKRLFVDVAAKADNSEGLPAAGEEVYTPVACSLIVHAGDVDGSPERNQGVLDTLAEIAPVKAVLGNCDYPGFMASGQPVGQHVSFECCGVTFAAMHKPNDLKAAIDGAGPLQPAFIKPKPRVRIHGHTHEAELHHTPEGILLCPGSVSRPSGRMLDTSSWFKTLAVVRVAEPGQLLTAELICIY